MPHYEKELFSFSMEAAINNQFNQPFLHSQKRKITFFFISFSNH